MSTSETESTVQPDCQSVAKRVVKRAGGRHLVFRVNPGPWWKMLKPYALISNIEGFLLAFYGVGQIWATHRKKQIINEWIVRVPRIKSARIDSIIDKLESEIGNFVDQIDELGIIGSLVIERRVIEFHWTLPGNVRSDQNGSLSEQVDQLFNRLARSFAQLQLVGDEGQLVGNEPPIEWSEQTQ